jgi:hypothetical protein
MLILQAALAALLAIPGAPVPPPPAARAATGALSGPELARAIRTDLESISGKGTVTVTVDTGNLFSARIAIAGFNSQVCAQIYDREMELRQLFPAMSFDFSFDGPLLARAIKADLEAISGSGTVDISIDSKTLFSVRVAIPGFSSEIYCQIYDRELEFYRAFRDLNFDFYLHPKPSDPY